MKWDALKVMYRSFIAKFSICNWLLFKTYHKDRETILSYRYIEQLVTPQKRLYSFWIVPSYP